MLDKNIEITITDEAGKVLVKGANVGLAISTSDHNHNIKIADKRTTEQRQQDRKDAAEGYALCSEHHEEIDYSKPSKSGLVYGPTGKVQKDEEYLRSQAKKAYTACWFREEI